MKIKCEIYEPMYDFNDKKYIRVRLMDKVKYYIEGLHNSKSHLIATNNIDNPLEGNILKLKVPFRYRRVMCLVHGDKPVQSLIRGDDVEIDVQFNGVWNCANHSGFSWKIKEIFT